MRAILALLTLVGAAHLHADCTGERWTVKVAADAEAVFVNPVAIPTTISFLRSLPTTRPLPQEGRVAPVEKTSYSLVATLTEYKLDAAGEAQLILSDEAGRTLIAEIPSLDCLAGSQFALEIEAARRTFDTRLSATPAFQRAMVPVEIRGIAFFDFLRDQHGMAPNGIEIRPVTSINFNPLLPPPPPRQSSRRRAVAPPAPPACRVPSFVLSANKSSACAGESVTLSWQSSDAAARVTIDGIGATLPASGNIPVSATNSSAWSGHATNSCGSSSEAVAVVSLRAAATATLSGPDSLQRGSSGTISIFLGNTSGWSLSSALRNAMTPSSGTGTGAFTSTFSGSTTGTDTVTLTATSACGSLTRSISIFVSEPVNSGLLCCDGTRSPSCFSCASKQGCCSGHRGVCGCP